MNTEKITDISIYIAALQQSFKPAKSHKTATHWFTTDDVYSAIKGIDSSAEISKDDIFQAMTAAGYQFQNRPGSSGLDFRWMLESKE